MPNALLLLQLLLQYSDKIKELGAVLANAHAEGRDVSAAELDAAAAADDEARGRLAAAIAAAKDAPPPSDQPPTS